MELSKSDVSDMRGAQVPTCSLSWHSISCSLIVTNAAASVWPTRVTRARCLSALARAAVSECTFSSLTNKAS